jgi:hypothetical protein
MQRINCHRSVFSCPVRIQGPLTRKFFIFNFVNADRYNIRINVIINCLKYVSFFQNSHVELLELGENKLCGKLRLQRPESASILCCTYVHFLPRYSYKAFDKNAGLVVPSQSEI